MNVNCNICSEIFLPQSKILAAPCGHTFHEECLLIWLERSETCPSCRIKTTTKNILRIYLSLLTSEGVQQDPSVLQCKLDNAEFQLKIKEKELQNNVKSCSKYKEKVIALREEVRDVENNCAILKSTIHALQSQISYFKTKAKEADRAQEEIVNLKKKVEGLEKTHFVLNATKEEVQEMVRHNNDQDTLCLLVTTLKRTLVGNEKRIRDLERTLKTARKDVTLYKSQLEDVTEENNKLKGQIECHKTCESVRLQLKRKIEELQQDRSSNTSTARIIAESPTPLKRARRSIEGETVDSPTIEERVQAIKDSDSPYLRFKTTSLGFLGSKLINAASRTPGKFSILKDAVLDVEKTKVSKSDVVFNGLGGHSKWDDSFPVPKKQTSIKRYKSTTKVASGKVKKLAPLPTSNNKLDNYVSLLTDDDDN